MFKLPRPQDNLISNSLKHFEALSLIAKESSIDDVNIVFEDDIMIDSNFKDKLEYFILNKVYTDYDCIFLCLPSTAAPSTAAPSNENDSVKPVGHLVVDKITDSNNKVVPSCDSYFVSKKGAEKMASGYMPIRFQHNIQMSFIFDKLKLNVGRCVPNISIDGSKIGEYPSTLSPNNILLYNVLFKTIYKTLEKEVITHEEIAQINKLFLENPLKDKADFLFLQGLFYLRFKEYSSCKEYFDRAIKMYEENFAPLNHQSAIIQNYIELSKHIQDL
jgi:GR25 family glycosyltransferase involved in LPS biosynthesis